MAQKRIHGSENRGLEFTQKPKCQKIRIEPRNISILLTELYRPNEKVKHFDISHVKMPSHDLTCWSFFALPREIITEIFYLERFSKILQIYFKQWATNKRQLIRR